MFRILETERLSSSLTRYVVEAPLIPSKRRAGHFVIVRVEEGGERIPLTIVDADPRRGTITLIVQAVGKTTKLLASKRAGDALIDVVGPLGNPTPIERHAPARGGSTSGAVACVGGGVGTAELLPIARALAAAGNEVHAVIGARTRELVILEHELAACSKSLAVVTDDGSYGRHGIVTLPLGELLAGPAGIAAVYAIGPLPMMRACAELTRPSGIKTYVSVNAIMVDGTGMCGGCRVTVGGEMKFACVDGPEFDGHQVDFDELIQRSRSYADLERVADERFACAISGARHGQPAEA